MSGYLRFKRTGSLEFDAVLSAIENAGSCYHNTADWQDIDEDINKSKIDIIDEKIDVARIFFETLGKK